MIPAILHYRTREEQAADLAEIVARELTEAVAEAGHATLAVPGGSTPSAFLAALSVRDEVPWARIIVMPSDERVVETASDRSNAGLLRRTLLRGPAAAATLVPLVDLDAGGENAIAARRVAVATALPLSVCVLGMGEDMHTASLFPGAEGLDAALAADAAVLMPIVATSAGEARVSLSGPVLRAAGTLHLLISGAAKTRALEAALREGPVAEAPVRAVLDAPAPLTVHYAD